MSISMRKVCMLVLCLGSTATFSNYAAAEDIDAKFSVMLPDGVTVEMIGLRYYSIEDLKLFEGTGCPWWKPDGSALAKAPDQSSFRTSASNCYWFIIRIIGSGNYSFKAVGPLGVDSNLQAVKKKGQSFKDADLRHFVLRFSSDQKEADIRLGLAMDKWEVVERWPFWEGATPEGASFGSSAGLIMRCPEQDDQDVVAETTQTILDESTRLVLFDYEKGLCEALRNEGGSGTGLVRYVHRFKDANLDDIERIEFQKRPYSYWITFKNVSLSPGRKTELKIEFEKVGALIAKRLPKFHNIKIDFSAENSKSKATLCCFFDMNQRPSRHCIRELGKKAEELKAMNVAVVAIQASKVDQSVLSAWIKKYNIPFRIGTIEENEEKVQLEWGVKALPWLILTDKDHIVRAEGFGIQALNEKVEQISGE